MTRRVVVKINAMSYAKLVAALIQCPATVQELAEETGLHHLTVSIHVRALYKEGDHPAVRMTPPGQCSAPQPFIPTLEGPHLVTPGDWIITGVKGEHYACKPDIFALTYEPEEAA